MPTSAQPVTLLPTSQQAALTLIHANGNLHLAAERLDLSLEHLTHLLSDPIAQETLASSYRTKVLTRTYTLLEEAAIAVSANIHSLDPYDAVKAYTHLAQVVVQLAQLPSQDNTHTTNTFEELLKALPPQVRGALIELKSATDSA